MAILEYLRLKLSLSSLAMMFMASTKDSWRWPPRLRLVKYGSNWACSTTGAWGAFVSGCF